MLGSAVMLETYYIVIWINGTNKN